MKRVFITRRKSIYQNNHKLLQITATQPIQHKLNIRYKSGNQVQLSTRCATSVRLQTKINTQHQVTLTSESDTQAFKGNNSTKNTECQTKSTVIKERNGRKEVKNHQTNKTKNPTRPILSSGSHKLKLLRKNIEVKHLTIDHVCLIKEVHK